MPTATDEKLATDLTDFRIEVEKRFGAVDTTIEGFRAEVKTDLRWIKGIGAALLLAAFGFAGWILRDMSSLASDVKQHGARLDKIEGRLDGMAKQLDTLIERTAPKAP
jgi:hypothetical protein